MEQKRVKTPSELYVEAMGAGINLGNTYDAFDRVNFTEIDDGSAWGNPEPTQEYMNALKNHGFKSLRIPFTAFTRIGSAPAYTINEDFFARYQKAVDLALNAGLYVMVNLHHDSGEWLTEWDGNPASEQYIKFKTLWLQLANRFKDYDEKVMFESINEAFFNSEAAPNDDEQNRLLGEINRLFYDTVRGTGGNNETRMLIIPTTYTNDQLIYTDFLADFIQDLDDDNLIATVHWYASHGSYAFTTNIGIQLFDEEINGTTAKLATEEMFDNLQKAFVNNGIGVVIGEYGLFNQGVPGSLNDGEVAKYIEYVNYKSRELGICPMMWDTGNVVNRKTGEWTNQTWGDMLTAAITERCSYAQGVDYVFTSDSTAGNDIVIPLVLNGNELEGISNGALQLTEGTDYTYEDATVTLKGSYISQLVNGEYGTKAELHFVFTAGTFWRQYVNYTGEASLENASGPLREDNGYLSFYDTDDSPTYPTFIIPGNLAGKVIRRIQSLDAQGEPASGNTWAAPYMQFGFEFMPYIKPAAYQQDILALKNWYTNAISDGTYTLKIEFFDGDLLEYTIVLADDSITGQA